MKMPTAYNEGYEKARALEPELASTYVAHTTVGDPEADAVIEDIAPLGQRETGRLIRAAMEWGVEDIRDAPSSLRDFFAGAETPPHWLDYSAFAPGVRMFHRNAKLILGAFVGGVLVEGFSTNISKSFFITGRLRDQGVRRLRQNNRHMVELFMPRGLEREGDGWKLTVRLRLVHAQVRRLLQASDDWDAESWGLPISSAHLAFAITSFSARLLQHMKNLGAAYNDEERASFMAVWRYTGHLMGIPEAILFQDEEDALKLFRIGKMCEPPPCLESISMAHALINSAPLVAGIEEPTERRKLAKYIYSISRSLIGGPLADELMYPSSPTIGILAWFRFQSRYRRFLEAVLPTVNRSGNFANFTSLLEASMFDEKGITYGMPDHVYAEESERW